MYAISVMIEVDPAHAEDYKDAALAHADNTKTNEKGCLGFAVFRSRDKPERFYLHEVYESKAAVDEVHNKAAYMAEFGALTAPWVRSKSIETWENAE